MGDNVDFASAVDRIVKDRPGVGQEMRIQRLEKMLHSIIESIDPNKMYSGVTVLEIIQSCAERAKEPQRDLQG